MFIEPNITFKTNKGITRIIPDLVICNTKEVIGVIELKYGPRANPKFAKDIQSLSSIAKHRGNIILTNERYLGDAADGKRYKLSKNILFIWAGVHASPHNKISTERKTKLYSEGRPELDGCFIELHAETRKNFRPDVYELS